MKRIRYIKKEDGSLLSMQIMKGADGVELRSAISPDGKEGYILNASGGVMLTITTTSAHKTKIKLKESLQKMGVVFSDETRKTTNVTVEEID